MKLYCKEHPRTLVIQGLSHSLLIKATEHSGKPQCLVELVLNDQLDLKYSKKLTNTEIAGILGLIHVDGLIFLVTIIQTQATAKPMEKQTINKIIKVEFFCLNNSQWDDWLFKITDPNYNPDEENVNDTTVPTTANSHPCYDLKKLLQDGSFFFSTDFDLTNNLQTRGVKDHSLIIDTYQEEYMWNYFMMSEMIQFRNKSSQTDQSNLDHNGFLTTAIRGFAKTNQLSVSNCDASLTIISRQSWKRAGTRFNSRGVDDDGNVSNFVETELILNVFDKVIYSFVEIRGSIPVFWEQDASQLTLGTPKVQITRSKEATVPIFAKHFDSLINKYGTVHVVNLLSTKPSEKELSNRYKSHILEYQKDNNQGEEDENPLLTDFDFHLQTKGGNYAAAKKILRYLDESTQNFEYFSFDYSNNKILTKQSGIFRTNCLDCLDRTNVVQQIISQHIMNYIIQDFHLNNVQELTSNHDSLWADNGDQISQIYTGTNALKSSFSRNGGKMTLGLFLSDATKSVTRMYQNNFVDQKKQITIDTLLGRLPGSMSEPVLLFDPIGEQVDEKLRQFESKFVSESIKTMFMGTFNLNGFNFTTSNRSDLESLIHWLTPDKNYFYSDQPDIYCLGFQEVVELNASSLLNVDYSKSAIWQKTINEILNSNGSNYTLIRSEQMSSLLILFFAKKSISDKITLVEGFSKKTGLGGIAGNKGAVAVRFNIGATSFCIINSHLASGSTAIVERNGDYETILNNIYFSRRGGKIKDHDNVIWLGDLNYRLNHLTNDEVRRNLNVSNKEFSGLLMNDQLLYEIQNSNAFKGFSENEITFPPTYKFDNYTNQYDTSEKQRIPAWTDRILYKGKSLIPMRDSYDSVMEVIFSDHKPVYCLFEANVKFINEEIKKKIYDELYENCKKSYKNSNNESMVESINGKKKSLSATPSRSNTSNLIEFKPTSSSSFLNNQPQIDLLSINEPPPPKLPARKPVPPTPPISRKTTTESITTKNPPPGFSSTVLTPKSRQSPTQPPPPPTPRNKSLQAMATELELKKSQTVTSIPAPITVPVPKPVSPPSPKPKSLPPGFSTPLLAVKKPPSPTPTIKPKPSIPPKPKKLASSPIKKDLNEWKPLVPK